MYKANIADGIPTQLNEQDYSERSRRGFSILTYSVLLIFNTIFFYILNTTSGDMTAWLPKSQQPSNTYFILPVCIYSILLLVYILYTTLVYVLNTSLVVST